MNPGNIINDQELKKKQQPKGVKVAREVTFNIMDQAQEMIMGKVNDGVIEEVQCFVSEPL